MTIDRTRLSPIPEEPERSKCGSCCFRLAGRLNARLLAGYDASSCQFVAEVGDLSASGGSKEIAFRLVMNAYMEAAGVEAAAVLAMDDEEAVRRCDAG